MPRDVFDDLLQIQVALTGVRKAFARGKVNLHRLRIVPPIKSMVRETCGMAYDMSQGDVVLPRLVAERGLREIGDQRSIQLEDALLTQFESRVGEKAAILGEWLVILMPGLVSYRISIPA